MSLITVLLLLFNDWNGWDMVIGPAHRPSGRSLCCRRERP
jgi:hypothetical protein